MEEKFELISTDSLLKKIFSSQEIIEKFFKMKIGNILSFYVECKGNTDIKYFDRIHLEKISTETLIIDIDKGSAGGTYSKSINTNQLNHFFQDIHQYIEESENLDFYMSNGNIQEDSKYDFN